MKASWRLGRPAVAVALLVACATAGAQTTAVERGQAKFALSCAPCHGAGAGDDGRAMLPGTEALQIKYRGALPAVLEQRTDLTAEALTVFVRRGTWSMPPFRKTELTDTEIADIAAYLAMTSRRAPAGR
jgi:mono/diheme cytochrome c family protein